MKKILKSTDPLSITDYPVQGPRCCRVIVEMTLACEALLL